MSKRFRLVLITFILSLLIFVPVIQAGGKSEITCAMTFSVRYAEKPGVVYTSSIISYINGDTYPDQFYMLNDGTFFTASGYEGDELYYIDHRTMTPATAVYDPSTNKFQTDAGNESALYLLSGAEDPIIAMLTGDCIPAGGFDRSED